jgi:small ligand-binding sensory domain FIST
MSAHIGAMIDEPFRVASATAEIWRDAAQAVVDGLSLDGNGQGAPANLGFLYVSDLLAANAADILKFMREKTGISHWVGTVGFGIVAGGQEFFDQPAICAMVADLPETAYRVFPKVSESASEMPGDIRTWAKTSAPLFGIVHGDPENAGMADVVAELAAELPAFLVGAMTASRSDGHQFADKLTDGGLSGVLFAPEVAAQTGLSQGFLPIGALHAVTESVEHVLMRLDDRSALEVLLEDLGDLGDDLSNLGGQIHVALPVAGSDTGDYTVRNLIGIDQEKGWIAAACELAPGDHVMFVRRDKVSAEADLRAMAKRVRARLDHPPRGALYISCIGRGPNMFDGASEAQVVQEAIGSDVPLIGIYANGEISNNRLYGYTGVLTLFP